MTNKEMDLFTKIAYDIVNKGGSFSTQDALDNNEIDNHKINEYVDYLVKTPNSTYSIYLCHGNINGTKRFNIIRIRR